MKHANGSEIHMPVDAEETFEKKLAKKVMFIGPNSQQVFLRPEIDFRIQFVESEKGTEIVLVFEKSSANPGGDSPKGLQSLMFILNDVLKEPLLERLVAIVPNEIQSFFLSVEIVPRKDLLEVGMKDQFHLNARFGDYQTRSVYSVDSGMLGRFVDLPADPPRPITDYIH
jgi:hypothetical protein